MAQAGTLQAAEIVERIWARDATLWTGGDEADWLGWLDEPSRMRDLVAEQGLDRTGFAAVVLLGMGGSSLAPEVFRRTFAAEAFHVLDTTHPAAIRRLESELSLDRTLFVAASKSGTTLETRSHLDYFWERAGERAEQFAVITDPGSELEQLARDQKFAHVFPGEPTIGGRYSALSPFGIVPAALMGVDVENLRGRAEAMADRCRLAEGPGAGLGLALGEGWRNGQDKVVVGGPDGFGLWAEQLLAESTGKEGKGLVPVADGARDGPDRQFYDVALDDPYDLAAEFYRWEFATAVAGAVLGINPFDQPNVQEAKDRTSELLRAGGEPELEPEPEGDLDAGLDAAGPGDYVAIQAFIDPAREDALAPLVERAAATGCVVTTGLGPRYLHSTGQLHKGGPNTGLFIQVVDEIEDELPIPGRDFGFRALIRAQAAGDFAALRERDRRIVRIRLKDVTR
jgi:transaldolase/glucose-6-phosphate isomerase